MDDPFSWALCRLQKRCPDDVMALARQTSAVCLPLHPTSASWLNAIEGFFAKLTKKRLKRGVFRSLRELKNAIHRFSTTPTQTQNPSSGPRTQTKSSPLLDEGTKC